ncbi:septal ring assembly protein ZapB [Salinivibrio sp. MA351]|jgi:cell division protein ZapB|uniref:Cell division protein ZapB n=1 Tax=Salinivibrio costicola subsp. alcaliphilus TaxID=272773 RepID=A0ABX3KUM3_SALCS|nr:MULTISPECIES: cell division protein ZapB [Salinivibrio]NUY55306.1 cell division protein ZapB [Salinivibrio sp. EAGSL]OOE89433.1 septal ring assembly protein ZapB [Salinivibrio sp. AR640]OOE91192.1 septal ring assembly protein ZapB [Salinivibrio sp. AR647]OOE98862.1 septal ring assembly protein ZapB [Salinivibrio sp. IB643]OOF00865.1 septal ring assembly protein ZapB [Salinivibrio sp. MA351]
MSLEVLEQLEAKVQMAVDTISLLQMEIEELKEKNGSLEQDAVAEKESREQLAQENAKLKEEQEAWQNRIRSLLGKIESVE